MPMVNMALIRRSNISTSSTSWRFEAGFSPGEANYGKKNTKFKENRYPKNAGPFSKWYLQLQIWRHFGVFRCEISRGGLEFIPQGSRVVLTTPGENGTCLSCIGFNKTTSFRIWSRICVIFCTFRLPHTISLILVTYPFRFIGGKKGCESNAYIGNDPPAFQMMHPRVASVPQKVRKRPSAMEMVLIYYHTQQSTTSQPSGSGQLDLGSTETISHGSLENWETPKLNLHWDHPHPSLVG